METNREDPMSKMRTIREDSWDIPRDTVQRRVPTPRVIPVSTIKSVARLTLPQFVASRPLRQTATETTASCRECDQLLCGSVPEIRHYPTGRVSKGPLRSLSVSCSSRISSKRDITLRDWQSSSLM